MFDAIKGFISRLSEPETDIHFEENDTRLAAAALLCHVMHTDGFVMDSEKDAIKDLLKKQYDLSDAEIDELIKEAEAVDSESVDFYQFTSVLKRDLDREGREKIVEMMWEVVLADGVVHELEDNVIWRVAELLGIETRGRVALRQKVEANLAKRN